MFVYHFILLDDAKKQKHPPSRYNGKQLLFVQRNAYVRNHKKLMTVTTEGNK